MEGYGFSYMVAVSIWLMESAFFYLHDGDVEYPKYQL